MLSLNLHSKIFKEYHEGKPYTKGTKYLYSLHYNPLSLFHTWIIRREKSGDKWYYVEPLAQNMQFKPISSVR